MVCPPTRVELGGEANFFEHKAIIKTNGRISIYLKLYLYIPGDIDPRAISLVYLKDLYPKQRLKEGSLPLFHSSPFESLCVLISLNLFRISSFVLRTSPGPEVSDHSLRPRVIRQCQTAWNLELRVDIVEVNLHCTLADEQPPPDLPIRQTAHQKPHHLFFPQGKHRSHVSGSRHTLSCLSHFHSSPFRMRVPAPLFDNPGYRLLKRVSERRLRLRLKLS